MADTALGNSERHTGSSDPFYPYLADQWERIRALGQRVDIRLQEQSVGLMMGGEPTFISAQDFSSAQWRTAALGDDKRRLAGQLLHELRSQFSFNGELLLYGLGKWYPGEAGPRWALGCYWRTDGVPVWRDRSLYADETLPHGYTLNDAQHFATRLVEQLGIPTDYLLPAYESSETVIVGYTLPLLSIQSEQQVCWSSCRWSLPNDRLILLPGTAPMGLRLPLASLSSDQLATEAIALLSDPPITPLPAFTPSPIDSIQIALSVEVRDGQLYIFLPPFASVRGFVDLIEAIEATASQTQCRILIEGYAPPHQSGIQGFQITPDPGVIEVNIHPASTWDELVHINCILYEAATACGLIAERYDWDGRRLSTGGGAHITLGGATVTASPLLRRPDILRSFITYFQHHPCLSYLFSGLFVGATSQSPRVDEARHESLYELEIAFQSLQPFGEVPPELVDRLLRNLLIDITGNTHRAALCIDKLFPVDNPRGQFGILEFRAVAMPPNAPMRIVQLLLIRALTAWFWEHPYARPLIRWGTTLHDRFFLPHYLWEDLRGVLQELDTVGYPLAIDWFQPFLEFRFPLYGMVQLQTPEGLPIQLELRHAIEPWYVLGESVTQGGTSRPVDASMERIQVYVRGAIAHDPNPDGYLSRYRLLCNGQAVPLRSTGQRGDYVAGVRFRARQLGSMLHPSIQPHAPLDFELIDTWQGRSLGGCTYHVNAPNGEGYAQIPTQSEEAQRRIAERFIPHAPRPVPASIPSILGHPDYPCTLDLRGFLGSGT